MKTSRYTDEKLVFVMRLDESGTGIGRLLVNSTHFP
jgi:hypothetical protein